MSRLNHEIYREDGMLYHPQSGERIRGRDILPLAAMIETQSVNVTKSGLFPVPDVTF